MNPAVKCPLAAGNLLVNAVLLLLARPPTLSVLLALTTKQWQVGGSSAYVRLDSGSCGEVLTLP